MKFLLFLLAFSDVALAAAGTDAQVYAAAHTDAFRNGTPGMIMAKGSTDNISYMLQENPTTGGLLVDIVGGSLVLGYDENYGTVGASTLRTAAQIGNATGAALFGAGTTTAQVLRVVLPTDQTSIPVTIPGRSYADSVRNNYATTNVTTSAWVQLIAATAATINCLTLFDSSGQTLELGTGAAASETVKLLIPPGGLSGCIPLAIPAGTRVAIKALSATASVGELDLTGLN